MGLWLYSYSNQIKNIYLKNITNAYLAWFRAKCWSFFRYIFSKMLLHISLQQQRLIVRSGKRTSDIMKSILPFLIVFQFLLSFFHLHKFQTYLEEIHQEPY